MDRDPTGTDPEEATGESLDGRPARELPDRAWDGDGELLDDEAGGAASAEEAAVHLVLRGDGLPPLSAA